MSIHIVFDIDLSIIVRSEMAADLTPNFSANIAVTYRRIPWSLPQTNCGLDYIPMVPSKVTVQPRLWTLSTVRFVFSDSRRFLMILYNILRDRNTYRNA